MSLEEELDTDTEEKPRGDRGRDQRDESNVATSPGTREPPEAGRSRKDPPQNLQEAQSWDPLILDFRLRNMGG